MAVLQVAYPLAPVGPDTSGGAEQVLCMLDAALVRSGHESFVVACEGSMVKGTLAATPRVDGAIDAAARARARERHREAVGKALARWRIDLVHMHGVDFEHYLPPPGVPTLVTLHLPLGWYSREALNSKRPGTYLHCVSAAQHASAPEGIRLLPVIENGIEVERFSSAFGRRNFVFSLGRICPEKGFHIGLDAAGRAGVPMLLAGEVFRYAEHERYFTAEIIPRLDGYRRRFIGPVGFERKQRLLSAARCLLVPSQVPETSSLAAMEALACGTPVVAFPAGALADIVEHGITGFLVNTAGEMAEAIHAAASIDPEACRRAAWKRFSGTAMAMRYIERYRLLCG